MAMTTNERDNFIFNSLRWLGRFEVFVAAGTLEDCRTLTGRTGASASFCSYSAGGARFLLCCIYTQVHAVTMVTWWEGGNHHHHQDLFLSIYRHTRIYLNFNQPRKQKNFLFLLSVLFFIYTFVRFIKCPPTHLGWLTPRPLSLYGTHTPPSFGTGLEIQARLLPKK